MTSTIGGLIRKAHLLLFAAAGLEAQICVAPPSGLVSWWPGDGNGNDIADQNPGTLRGDATFAIGKVGDAFSFNGAGEIRVADRANLNVRELTMEAWVFPTGADGEIDVFLNKEFRSGDGGIFVIQYEMGRRGNADPAGTGIPAGNFAFYLGGLIGLPSSYKGWVDGLGLLPLNTWTHVAVTFDGSTARAFVNGVATRTITGLTGALNTTAGDLKIGARSDGINSVFPGERFTGRVDEVDVFNRALSPSEIQAIFNASTAGKCKPLLSLNSASFVGLLAPDMIAFGAAPGIAPSLVVATSDPWPTTLGGVRLDITDSQGQTRTAPIYYVSTDAMAYLMPSATALGLGTAKLTTQTAVIMGTLNIERLAPGLYTANSSGSGVPAGFWIRVAADGSQTYDYLFDPTKPVGSRVPVPVDLGPTGDKIFLSLYGTGFRGASQATATVGDLNVPVSGFAAVGVYQGEDVVNIGPLPRSLAGRGEISVVITFDGKVANTVTVSIR